MATLKDEEVKECMTFASNCIAGFVLTLLLLYVSFQFVLASLDNICASVYLVAFKLKASVVDMHFQFVDGLKSPLFRLIK